jgi:hypothetical protein
MAERARARSVALLFMVKSLSPEQHRCPAEKDFTQTKQIIPIVVIASPYAHYTPDGIDRSTIIAFAALVRRAVILLFRPDYRCARRSLTSSLFFIFVFLFLFFSFFFFSIIIRRPERHCIYYAVNIRRGR